MKVILSCSLVALSSLVWAQVRRPSNLDEARVGNYTLPPLLVLENGQPVRDAAAWNSKRRPEILKQFESEVYGRTPRQKIKITAGAAQIDPKALGGKAIRKQVTLQFSEKSDGPRMDLLIYVPARGGKPAPLFLGLNFQGNHAVNADPGINLGRVWTKDPQVKGKFNQRIADETARGAVASRWPVETILDRGYALATANYYDIEPDFSGGIGFGVRPLFFRPGQTEPGPDEWGAIGAWAWGLSRAMDYLQTDKDIDSKKIAVIGHSRLGKTALWAGAQDPRFAIVISNDSGEGGAALSRRDFGETVAQLNMNFPHWFSRNYRKYADDVDKLPVDHHMLLALIAPRPLYVASADQDLHADPRGEFLSAVHAGQVYKLFGKPGIGTDEMPKVNTPIGGTVRYHMRAGKHDVTSYDWAQYLDFADANFQKH
ncbi:MAG TPA: hypothetical protein VMZ52_12020 [Bryobacteraceae bacterium]|nr:hypothetical protein [Bryobacteraceae bacterium]